MMVYCNSWVIT